MRVLLIAYDNDSKIAYFPLGLAYIASALRNAGHDVKIYEQDVYHYSEDHLVHYCNDHHFDAIGVGSCGGYYQYRKIKMIAKAIDSIKDKPFFWMGGAYAYSRTRVFFKEF